MNTEPLAAETELPNIKNDDEFIENATDSRDEVKDNNDGTKTASPSHPHDKWLWLHAAFHCLVTMVVSVI